MVAKTTPASRANVHRLAYIGRAPTQKPRDADSWFTPQEYLDSVRAVMGGIDLDPFTSDAANAIVGAAHVFTADKSAFSHDWMVCPAASVFMNPPYSAGACGRAVNRFIDQYGAGRFVQGIVLVNNATDTRWFSALVHGCDAICFTDHRISFWNDDRKNVSGNTRGQAFFYFGPNVKDFGRVFKKHGYILLPQR